MKLAMVGSGGVTLLLIACSGQRSRCPDGSEVMPCPGVQVNGTDGGALSDCILGGWFDYGDGGACPPSGYCDSDAGPPECKRTDCTVQTFNLYVASPGDATAGVSYFGGVIFSRAAGTWSSPVPAVINPYRIEMSQLVYDGGFGIGVSREDAVCGAQELVLGGFFKKVRLSPGDSAALLVDVTDAGTWFARPFP
jgi:hypothetical protein